MADVVDDKNFGWSEIEKEMRKFSKSSILVGFQEGTKTRKEIKGERSKEGGLSIPEIAASNEFGDGKIPPRPFMSTSFDENRGKIVNIVGRQIARIEGGSRKASFALDVIGLSLVTMIQTKIDQIVTPPNSPVTIKLKGSSKPLIDFGQMRQSVRHKVVT